MMGIPMAMIVAPISRTEGWNISTSTYPNVSQFFLLGGKAMEVENGVGMCSSFRSGFSMMSSNSISGEISRDMPLSVLISIITVRFSEVYCIHPVLL